jgi:linker histone H1 and H5 family
MVKEAILNVSQFCLRQGGPMGALNECLLSMRPSRHGQHGADEVVNVKKCYWRVFCKAQRQNWQQVRVFTILPCFDFPALFRSHSYSQAPGWHCPPHSRQAIKKYVKANNKGLTITSEASFDVMFNKAIKTGVEKGEFTQPKGMSPSNGTSTTTRTLALLWLLARIRMLCSWLMHILSGPSGPVKLAKKEAPATKAAAPKVMIKRRSFSLRILADSDAEGAKRS